MGIFRVSGENLDLDACFEIIEFEPVAVWRKGEQISRRSEKVHVSSGFNISFSDAEFVAAKRQIQDAIDFMQANAAWLAELRQVAGVERLTLDFPIQECAEAAVQFQHLPAELVSLAGALGFGLEISIYYSENKFKSASED